MSGSLSTTATSSMRPPITAGPISRNLSVFRVAARSGGGGGVGLGGAAAAKKRQIAAVSMPRKISPCLVVVSDALADHLNKLLEIERLEDGVADGVGRDFLHAALARGGENDDVRAAIRQLLRDLLDELVAVETRHHQIEQNQIELAVPVHFVQPDCAVLGQLDVEFHPSQNGLEKDADGQVVVDDQYPLARAVEFAHHSRCASRTLHCERHTGLKLKLCP